MCSIWKYYCETIFENAWFILIKHPINRDKIFIYLESIGSKISDWKHFMIETMFQGCDNKDFIFRIYIIKKNLILDKLFLKLFLIMCN